MKKYLSSIAAILTVISLAGCSANNGGTNTEGGSTIGGAAAESKYEATDIGGRPSSGKSSDGILSGLFGKAGATDDMAAGGAMAEFATTDTAAPSFAGTDGVDIIIDPTSPSSNPQPEPQAGMLTGGEWNDNAHWSDWEALYSSHEEWNEHKKTWKSQIDNRIAVKVTSNGQPVAGAKVSCKSAISSAVTDNKGMAYLFYTAINGPTEQIVVDYKGNTKTICGVIGSTSVECELDGVSDSKQTALDFMIMCDTTGSMSDELEYLKVELENIVRKVGTENANITIRTSVNFYRDEGDEYVVRQFPFTSDIEKSAGAIKEQSSDGGGDFPEAVHTALDSAINQHEWNEDAVKIMFLVLDAPPHSEDAQVVSSVNKYICEAAEKGIRIVPIASSGIDKSTEYLLRTMAFSTGGTYTFLTNDSGIGGSHIEPTVGAFNVEKLSDMMVRIVNGYLE
ncbi:MAG: vWA domain-containing protein [Oscillospiraceae bacterium]